MKISQEGGAGLPSRETVEEAVNPRARNEAVDGAFPRNRTPFGTGKLRLGVTQIPGYHMHWIADYPGRLEEAQDNGYEPVLVSEVQASKRLGAATDSAGEFMTRISGSHESGRPMVLHLMKIRQDWYEENQAFYQKRSDAIDKQIKQGKIDGVRHPESYNPKGGRITIDTKLE